jgi:hypothetical protein
MPATYCLLNTNHFPILLLLWHTHCLPTPPTTLYSIKRTNQRQRRTQKSANPPPSTHGFGPLGRSFFPTPPGRRMGARKGPQKRRRAVRESLRWWWGGELVITATQLMTSSLLLVCGVAGSFRTVPTHRPYTTAKPHCVPGCCVPGGE